jgi:hypothetical protein
MSIEPVNASPAILGQSKIPHEGPIHHEGEGGSLHIGGSLPSGGAVGPLSKPGRYKFPDNPVDAYHYILNMTPQQLEMKREIASQLLGAVPSKMWGKLVDNEDKPLEANAHHYENITRLPNTHAMARMLEGEHEVGHGAGFWKSLKHVGRIAGKAYLTGRIASKLAYDHRHSLLKLAGMEDALPQVEMMAKSLKGADKVLKPIAEKLSVDEPKIPPKNASISKQRPIAELREVKKKL